MIPTTSHWKSMFLRRIVGSCLLGILTAALQGQVVVGSPGGSRVLYQTGFESAEGFSGTHSLSGQAGWMSFGSGGNGIVTNYFADGGQQAWMGASPPSGTDDSLSLLHPVAFTPSPGRSEVVTFSVVMAIMDSTTTNRDDFRWSIYNSQGNRLFSLDFDNSTLGVSYGLDDNKGFIDTGVGFTNSSIYELSISLNFARNLWSASANGLALVTGKPITTQLNTRLDLADIDAVWLPRDLKTPGDNYLLFDDYSVVLQHLDSIPPVLQFVNRLTDGQVVLKLSGEPNLHYTFEATTDLKTWTPIQKLLTPDNGIVLCLDPGAAGFPTRIYRAYQSP